MTPSAPSTSSPLPLASLFADSNEGYWCVARCQYAASWRCGFVTDRAEVSARNLGDYEHADPDVVRFAQATSAGEQRHASATHKQANHRSKPGSAWVPREAVGWQHSISISPTELSVWSRNRGVWAIRKAATATTLAVASTNLAGLRFGCCRDHSRRLRKGANDNQLREQAHSRPRSVAFSRSDQHQQHVSRS